VSLKPAELASNECVVRITKSPPFTFRLMRRLCILFAAIMSPALLSAQTPSAAPSSNVVAQTFRGFGRPYGTWLLAALDSIPASQYVFKPTPVQQSIGYIAQHLEDANAEFGVRICRCVFERVVQQALLQSKAALDGSTGISIDGVWACDESRNAPRLQWR